MRENHLTHHTGHQDFYSGSAMPTSTPHVREATHTHTMRLLKHTHTRSSDQPRTHIRSGRAPRTQGHTNYALHREHSSTHIVLPKNKTQGSIHSYAQWNEKETQGAKSR